MLKLMTNISILWLDYFSSDTHGSTRVDMHDIARKVKLSYILRSVVGDQREWYDIVGVIWDTVSPFLAIINSLVEGISMVIVSLIQSYV
jgi:hypothetical protein